MPTRAQWLHFALAAVCQREVHLANWQKAMHFREERPEDFWAGR